MSTTQQKSFPVTWDQFHRDSRALAWRLMGQGTLDAVVEDVVEVAELHRLFDVFLRARHVGRAAQEHRKPNQAPDQQENAGETDFGQCVGATMEDLRHRRLVEWLARRTRRKASRTTCTML